MKTLSVGEYDLLNFFEMIPSLLEPDVPWAENDSVYQAAAHVQLSFALAPLYNDVRVILRTTGEATVYELNAMGVDDVRYYNDNGREALRVIVSPRESIWIRLKPGISIDHRITHRETG